MSTELLEPLSQAMGHIQASRLADARSLLLRFVREHPDSDRAWYLLSLAVTERAKQFECLDRALRINPQNGPARERMAGLLNAPLLPQAAPDPQAAPPTAVGAKVDSTSAALLDSLQSLRDRIAAAPAQADEPVDSLQSLRDRIAHAAPLEPDAPVQPAAPRRRPTWGVLALIAVLVVGVIAFGVYGSKYVFSVASQPTATQVVVAAVTPVVHPSLPSAVYPTLPPTWTATPLPSPTPAPSATSTPTLIPTSTFEPPGATEQGQMDKIDQQVADLRGLTIETSNPRFLIPQSNVEQVLRGQFAVPALVQELENDKITYSALGLIKPTYDLVRYELNSNADAIGGFYIPWTKQMWVIGDHFSGVERFVYSHEFDHALTDQHFHVGDMGVYPTCLTNAQRCEAIRALVEGDATLLMTQWWKQYATPKDYKDIAAYQPPSQTLPDESPPPWVSKDLAFPYQQGLSFVQGLYQRGNWAAVDKAYANLPASTEHILHIDKYLTHELPIIVADPPLTDTLGAGWRSVGDDVLGEWTTYLVLGYGADVSAQLDDAVAQKAADGWGGDHYQAFYNAASQQTVLVAHWAWDTATDAHEFSAAMRQYQNLRFRGEKVDRADGACWEANGQASCTFDSRAGNETLWLLAPNQTVLNQVLAAFPSFDS